MQAFVQAILAKHNTSIHNLSQKLSSPQLSSIPRDESTQMQPLPTIQVKLGPKKHRFQPITKHPQESNIRRTAARAHAASDTSEEVREAQQRKRMLLMQLKEVDYKIKCLKDKQRIQKSNHKSRKQLKEQTVQQTRKALELVRKMNSDRRKREQRKIKETRQVQAKVHQSLSRIRQQQQVEQIERQKKKQQLIRQIQADRKLRRALRNLNHQSDRVVQQMKKHPTVFQLTSLPQSESSDQVKLPLIPYKNKYRSPFLQNVLKDQRAVIQQQYQAEQQKHSMLERRLSYNNIHYSKNRKPQPKFKPLNPKQKIEKSIIVRYEYQPIVS